MCTTIIVGEHATVDGSFLVARSADSSSLKAQHFVIHPAVTGQSGVYSCKAHGGVNDFSYPLPENAMRYTTVPNWKTQLHGAVGFNEAGLGLTGTESIFASDEALSFDPYNKASGITEDDIPNVILPRCRTAKEGVLLLGKIIETQGAGEGFGVAFVDQHDVWYLETGSGHQWMAERIPADSYFASGNQGRLGFYDPKNENQLASPTLVSFAAEKGLYDPAKGPFHFSAAYTRDDGRDRVYNDPRVWIMQKILNPSIEQPVDDGRNFAVYLKPEKKVSLADMKAIMRDHYLPLAIGEVVHVAFGMADLSVFVPFYHGLESVPEQYGLGTDHCDNRSVYWKYRKVQTLAMTNYPKFAPIVKKAYGDFEATIDEERRQFEARYLELVKTDEKAANAELNRFNLSVLARAEAIAENLQNDILTQMTADTEERIVFKNNKSKD